MSDDDVNVSSDGSVTDEEETAEPLGFEEMGKQSGEMVDVRSLQQSVRQQDALHTESGPMMTKYEYARVRGERLQQLNSGAIPCVPYSRATDTNESIFVREFESGKLPFLVERKTPDGECKYIKIRQFANCRYALFE